MTSWATRLTVLCVAVLILAGVVSAQEVQFDLILEKTFASRTRNVGIDYDAQGRPIFTIASEDRVEVMDSEGNVETIVPGLTKENSTAVPSENGRFVGILRWSDALDSLTGERYSRYHFTLMRRNGATVYEVPNYPLNDGRLGNNGAVCGIRIFWIGKTSDWLYYDPEGNLTRQFPSSSRVAFFGDSGSYLLGHGGTVSAYTGNHSLLWSIDFSSPAPGPVASSVSADGHYLVRYHTGGAEFYRDGELVHTDTTIAGSWESKPKVIITPDNKHALLITGTGERAYLWNLEENRLVQAYEPLGPSGRLGCAACGSGGQWVIFSTFTRDTSAPSQHLISLYDPNAQVVWQGEAPPEETSVAGISVTPWLTVDPTGTYICQRDRTKLWLYKRR